MGSIYVYRNDNCIFLRKYANPIQGYEASELKWGDKMVVFQ